MISRRAGVILLAGLTTISIVSAPLRAPVPQPLAYHRFADPCSWLGIPNFGNVVSNLPFALVGILGIVFLVRSGRSFTHPKERWPYSFVFLGLILTSFGSSHYHLAPDNARLVWDRLPMTIVFTSLVAAMNAERISVRLGLYLLPVLLALGIASVNAMVLERIARGWRSAFLRGCSGLFGPGAVTGPAVSSAPYARHGLSCGRRVLCSRQDSGDGRSTNLRVRLFREWAYLKACGRCDGGILDSTDAAETQPSSTYILTWDRVE
jgi:hypothetical protein